MVVFPIVRFLACLFSLVSSCASPSFKVVLLILSNEHNRDLTENKLYMLKMHIEEVIPF
jgi:hypothetical protein